MFFVDTGAWVAIADSIDEHHAAATAWRHSNREDFLTTDFVVDETLTLLRARGGGNRKALWFGSQIFAGNLADLHRITDEEYAAAWETCRRYADKEWSFTDCTSKVVMEARWIRRAFAFDQHFGQFGSVAVAP